jgi:hypothetical protein
LLPKYIKWSYSGVLLCSFTHLNWERLTIHANLWCSPVQYRTYSANMNSLMWTQNVYINFAHTGFQNVEFKVKQMQSQCTSLQPYLHIHHDIAACCVKGTCNNWWQHSQCHVISCRRFPQIELLISNSDVCWKWNSRLIVMNWEYYFITVCW